MQHTAPSGFTFTLRDPEDVPESLRRPIGRVLMRNQEALVAARNTGATPDPTAPDALPADFDMYAAMDRLDEQNDLMVVALISEWSLALPITVENVRGLGKRDYKHLRKLVAPFVSAMLPDYGDDSDPESPPSP